MLSSEFFCVLIGVPVNTNLKSRTPPLQNGPQPEFPEKLNHTQPLHEFAPFLSSFVI